MTAFDFHAMAELFPGPGRSRGVSYKRFETAAEAIRFALEPLDAKILSGAILEVNEERFNEAGMRDLYANSGYPLPRRNRFPKPQH